MTAARTRKYAVHQSNNKQDGAPPDVGVHVKQHYAGIYGRIDKLIDPRRHDERAIHCK